MKAEKVSAIKEKVCKIFDHFLGHDYLLFVFGSLARQATVQSSDIDLAVYRKQTISPSVIAHIREQLADNAGTLREIDLVNLTEDTINVDLLANILQEGVVWKNPENSQELLKSLRKRLKNLRKL